MKKSTMLKPSALSGVPIQTRWSDGRLTEVGEMEQLVKDWRKQAKLLTKSIIILKSKVKRLEKISNEL